MRRRSNAGKPHRHPFRFMVLGIDGKLRTITAWARVKKAKKEVPLDLDAVHIRKAIRKEGFGNTQTCMMAVCTNSQADRFPHPVEGLIDWQYRSAFVCTHVDKNGFPSQCVVYEHRNMFARHFDKFRDSKKSMRIIKQLLRKLDREGPMQIILYPPKPKAPRIVPQGKYTGERSRRLMSTGAHRRFAIANPGLSSVS